MNILVSIVCFILGFVTNTIVRKVMLCIYIEKEKIKYAEEIIRKEQKRNEFKEKYDFSDCFEDENNK